MTTRRFHITQNTNAPGLKKLLLLLCITTSISMAQAQTASDTLKAAQQGAAADDPSQFLTRTEVFSNLQRYDKSDFYLSQTTLRTIVKIGKRFTTRVDIPYVYNSFEPPSKPKQSGLGDISFRLLGYQILQSRKSALTASVEVSLNTAQSPLLGLGKNLFIPVVTYSTMLRKRRNLFAIVLQQVNSFSGDEERKDISFTKIQPILLNVWSRRIWTVVAPEWYIDYKNNGELSMNVQGRFAFAPTPRINLWVQGGAGVFGDFPGRYQWSAEIGSRYFWLRSMNLKKKNSGK
ncbi:MAG TPA: hypothetical protein PK228_13415 [Saprospiraceae bacterium]|nr:hypothetical protein [Saprospiraceae bacterium]